MHAFVTARGMPDYINRWENDCLAHHLPFFYDFYKPAGSIQFSLRPVRIYDCVFPARQYETAMSMLRPNSGEDMKTILFALRKIMGAEKPAPYKYDKTKWIPRQNVSVNVIGVKQDKWKNGIEQI